ncbi:MULTISPECIES: PstS family phosphate ABC transporter substrate-binding protein [unclassified Kaistella]|uniref:PstS family phosphate ABC transporter substrate-binding protein n=1 Tax=unclassified Kaistella TaxID=2762626 RepID=UPI002734286F|nr:MULTISPECIES: substrate-binding domain-containing protein [unclassified Kaistella]MDP2454885.1 substrate-binding domain-containing protein [Kaistella sp. SH11-4b]MDP2456132.1 substrate-binding domain-containing protein [Kaistella sp. SH40-3]MDP2460555.1 substrate-binding domain-containing protein [Kaistella sp. SH19-2b]
MKNSVLLMIFFFTLSISCKKKPTKLIDSPQQGEITMEVDESFASVSEALTDRYMALYPKTKINLKIKKEDFAFLDLLEGKVRVIVMSRELNESEKKAYKKETTLDWLPAKFAGDAVVFIVPKNSPKETITIDEIRNELNNDKKNIIFDGTNSSNLNFVAQKLNTKPDQLRFSIINGNKNLIEQLNAFPDKIGVISLNTISRPYDPESENLKNSVKILKVVEGNKAYEPRVENLANMSYPFTRVLYFLTNEKYFGLGNGFIRFSCTQIGQIVVSKEGLQPYHIFKREVQMR